MVDDHVMVLQALKNLLQSLLPGVEIDTAESAASACCQAGLRHYDLLLMDWKLPDALDGQLLLRLREAGCLARIVVLSGESDSRLVERAIEMGASGFVPKTYSSGAMIDALNTLMGGSIHLPSHADPLPEPVAGVLQHQLPQMTPRQREVYLGAARGLSNKLIARELGIAESTVKTHLAAIYAMLGVNNRTEAAYQALREGLRLDA